MTYFIMFSFCYWFGAICNETVLLLIIFCWLQSINEQKFNEGLWLEVCLFSQHHFCKVEIFFSFKWLHHFLSHENWYPFMNKSQFFEWFIHWKSLMFECTKNFLDTEVCLRTLSSAKIMIWKPRFISLLLGGWCHTRYLKWSIKL